MRSVLFIAILAGFGLAACATRPFVVSYETPEKTFESWSYAARELDLNTILESYAASARPSIEDELRKSSQESLQAMQSEAVDTEFKIERIVYEDDIAYLRVRRNRDKLTEIEVITMVKENDQWKLLP